MNEEVEYYDNKIVKYYYINDKLIKCNREDGKSLMLNNEGYVFFINRIAKVIFPEGTYKTKARYSNEWFVSSITIIEAL